MKKKPLPTNEWPLIFESPNPELAGILYGARGKYPNHEMQRLGHKREFIMPRKKMQAVKDPKV